MPAAAAKAEKTCRQVIHQSKRSVKKRIFLLGQKVCEQRPQWLLEEKKGEEEKTQLETVGTHPAKNVPKII